MADSVAWLSVVGINENGMAGLNDDAKAAIASAALVAGGKRHLELAKALIQGETLDWPSPPHDAIPRLLARRPAPVCVLCTGDPFHYGMGAVLARHIPVEEMRVFPAPSIFSQVAAQMGWALQNTICIGLNGRPAERIIPQLQPGAHIIALCADQSTPLHIVDILKQRGFGAARLTLFEHLGGKQERVRTAHAADAFFDDILRLNCMAIDIPDTPEAKTRALPLTSGLDDAWFGHDGQMTKREVRAVTLSSLAPRKGEMLWDIGLGAGSIAIEWMLCDPTNRAIGFEKNAQRAERAMRNAQALGVPGLVVIHGQAPEALEGLDDAPDAIFIGGGASEALIDECMARLKPGGRLVVNAVTLETETLILAEHRRHGGALIRIGVERAEPVGGFTGWKPGMTVTQWSITT